MGVVPASKKRATFRFGKHTGAADTVKHYTDEQVERLEEIEVELREEYREQGRSEDDEWVRHRAMERLWEEENPEEARKQREEMLREIREGSEEDRAELRKEARPLIKRGLISLAGAVLLVLITAPFLTGTPAVFTGLLAVALIFYGLWSLVSGWDASRM